MSMSKSKTPAYNPPATKPERQVDVEPEDIQLGDEASQDPTKRGKRSLMRPSGAMSGANAGGTTGTGIAV